MMLEILEADVKAWEVQDILKVCRSKEIPETFKCFTIRYAILPGPV